MTRPSSGNWQRFVFAPLIKLMMNDAEALAVSCLCDFVEQLLEDSDAGNLETRVNSRWLYIWSQLDTVRTLLGNRKGDEQ